MADHQGENAQNLQGENMPDQPSAEHNHAREAMMVLGDHELRELQQDIEMEIGLRVEARRQQEEERRRERAQIRRERMYAEWYPKYKMRRERKDADWEEKHEEKAERKAGVPKYGTSDEDSDDSDLPARYMSYEHEYDDESSYGDDEMGEEDEDDIEGVGNGDESDSEPPEYTEEYLQHRFDYERRHPRKYARTLNEGEMFRCRISARIPISDSESESSGVTAAGSSTDDSELGGEEGWEE